MFNTRKFSVAKQYAISLIFIFMVATTCFLSQGIIGYKLVALILLMSVSLLAMLFDIMPVLIASLLSALVWNFFFIPPIYTFHISNTEDVMMFFLYFVIASVNAVLTFKIRKEEKKSRDQEEKENTIKLYNNLLNSLSHELRTPISAIVSAVDTLKESDARLTAMQKHELLDQIDLAGSRLNRQVENLLNMSRLETGMLKLNLDWCDTNELISGVIQKQGDASGHKILFVPDDRLPLFKYDRGLMEQILQNLLHNAIHHTPEGSTINISVCQQDDRCVIEISDNGPGIPDQETSFIFDKFYRLPQARTGGSGLGLSIVKGYAEAHKGQVTLEKNSDDGARFRIEIPSEVSYINNLKNE